MSKKFLVNLDLNKNELQNVVIHKLAIAPTSPVVGQIYFNTSDEKYYLRQTTGWKDVSGRLEDVLSSTNALTVTDNGDGTVTLGIASANASNAGLMTPAHHDDLTAATNLATASTLVKRDVNGDAAFNQIVSDSLIINEVIDGATPGTHAVSKGYVDTLFSTGTRIQGSIDCSANPSYPVSAAGDIYYVSVAGRIGGASGNLVDVGDMLVSVADSLGGAEAIVGADWLIIEHNIEYASTAIAGYIRIATNAEVIAGVSTDTAVSPAELVAYIASSISGGRFAADVGDGVATAHAVLHGLNNTDVQCQVRDSTSNELVECDVVVTSATTVTVTFAVAPATNAYRVVVQS